jgi:hypothetical protein
MSVVIEKPKKGSKKSMMNRISTEQNPNQEVSTKKKTLGEVALELAKAPLFTIDEKDRDLVYGSNMMTRLLQEEAL